MAHIDKEPYLQPIRRLVHIVRRNAPVFRALKKAPAFVRNYYLFKRLSQNDNRFTVSVNEIYPKLSDALPETKFDAHYLYYPAWAARILKKTKPKIHIDIGSSVNFCSTVSAFVPVGFFDFRPAKIKLDNLTSNRADILSLPFGDSSQQSISCMHVIEHIGLGRYGEAIDPFGDLKAISELKRVLGQGGNLLIVVPVSSKATLMFNAHRIYQYQQIMDYFDQFKLMDFSLVTDSGELIRSANAEDVHNQNYGAGCWWFSKS